MKHFLSVLCLMLSSPVFAITWKIQGPCDSSPVHQGQLKADLNESWGKTSLRILNENKIPFKGDEEGFSSMIGTPIGMEAIELVSKTTIRAYGWCYSVNGEIPDRMPHELKPHSQNDNITWFFAYSTNHNNEWTDYCVPSHKIRAPQFCATAPALK